MSGIRTEIITFFIAVIAGVIIRLSYQCLSCFRNIVKHDLKMIGAEDIIFWIGTAIYLFVQIYHTSNGSIRWYFALGVVFGVLISTFFLRKIKKMSKKIYDFHSGKSIAKKGKKRYYNKY